MNAQTEIKQGIILNDNYIPLVIEAFFYDRQNNNCRPGTMYFYRAKLALWQTYCDSQLMQDISQVDANFIRRYLSWLEETGHNAGGRSACYRALKAMMYWWYNETEPAQWRNPFHKVKQPKVDLEPLDPVSTDAIKKLISVSDIRDKSIILMLVDTGMRASELCALDKDDIQLLTGEIIIRVTKSRYPRSVFMGKKTRHALRSYLRTRSDDLPGLFLSNEMGNLSYWGLRDMIDRRSKDAGISPPPLHSFRRYFAITMLRAGVDIYTLQKIMGHADLQVLRRYLKLVNGDLKAAHAKASPVDHLSF